MRQSFILIILSLVLGISSVSFGQSAEEILSRFSSEPDIQSTQDAAVEHAGLSSDRLEGLYYRAGASRALPKSAQYQFKMKDEDRERKMNESQYDGGSVDAKARKEQFYVQPTDTMEHTVKAQWDLSGLIFNSDQLRVVREMSNSAKYRDKLLGDVTKVYYERRKLQVSMVTNPPKSVEERLKQELAIEEKTARLDAFTGGWFSKQLKGGAR